MKKVLITCPPLIKSIESLRAEFAKSNIDPIIPSFSQSLTEDRLIELVPSVDGWIIGDDPATARVFKAGVQGKLRAAVKWGVGVDNVDFTAAQALGLDVVNTPGMFSEEVSDIVVCYTIGLARDLFRVDRGVRAGHWPKPVGLSLQGKTAGIVGYGNIGKATAKKLIGLGLRVIVYDPDYRSDPAVSVQSFPWPKSLAQADFLILTCSLTPANRDILNEQTLAACKKGVRVINVSRGPLIDELALVKALQSGHVAGAALDVFYEEPLPACSALRGFEQCVFGSHNASNTVEAVKKTSQHAIRLLLERLL